MCGTRQLSRLNSITVRIVLPDLKLLTPKTVPSAPDAVRAQRTERDGATRSDRICWILKRAANVAIGVAAGGIPWTLYNFDGYGPTVMFSGFVLYLILMELHSRLSCD
jgi:hypothetical protein